MSNSTISRLPMKLISEVGEVFTGSTPSTSDRTLYGDEYPFFGPSDLDNGKYLYSAEKNLSDKGFAYSRKIPKNAILFARIGIIGKVGIAKRDSSCNQQINFIIPKSGIDYQYLYYVLQFVSPIIRDNATTQVVPMINKSEFEKFEVPIPDYEEQKVIAKALSDVDELIAGLKIEIEKNSNIKNGLVQRNLNPLVPNSKLRDHATMASGGTPLTSVSAYYGGEIPWVSITDMTDSGKYIERTVRNLTESGLLNSSAVIYPMNTLLFAMYASIGKCALPKVPVASSQAILGITVKPSLNIDYVYYVLTSRTQDFIAMGQQGTQSNLNKIIVGDFNIPVPPLKDQEKIAAEFINIDLKIDALKSELAKYECIKQGMAHDLLSGKVRLV